MNLAIAKFQVQLKDELIINHLMEEQKELEVKTQQGKGGSGVKQLFKDVFVEANICWFKRIGFDATNLLVNKTDPIVVMVVDMVKAEEGKLKDALLLKIVKMANKAVINFLKEIEVIIRYVKQHPNQDRKCIFVFDGKKLKKKGKRKHFNWRRFEGQEDRPRRQKPQRLSQYWKIYNYIMETIMWILERLDFEVLVAPFEADIQLVKLYQERFIECVVSNDFDSMHMSVPVIREIQASGKCKLIDFKKVKLKSIQNQVVRKWIKMTRGQNKDDFQNLLKFQKRVTFGLLSGSPYLERFYDLQLENILEILMAIKYPCNLFPCIKEAISDDYVPSRYEDQFYETLMVFLYGTCYSKKNKKIEYLLNEKGQCKVHQYKTEEEHQHNHEIVGFIGCQYCNYTKDHRTGRLNINTGNKRIPSPKFYENTVDSIINRTKWFSLKDLLRERMSSKIEENQPRHCQKEQEKVD